MLDVFWCIFLELCGYRHIYICILHAHGYKTNFPFNGLQERLREAAKQQVRRLCQAKKKRTYLNAPSWLLEAYKTADKNQMAQLLMDCNWSKDCWACYWTNIGPILFHFKVCSKTICDVAGGILGTHGSCDQKKIVKQSDHRWSLGFRERDEGWSEVVCAHWLHTNMKRMMHIKCTFLFPYTSCHSGLPEFL